MPSGFLAKANTFVLKLHIPAVPNPGLADSPGMVNDGRTQKIATKLGSSDLATMITLLLVSPRELTRRTRFEALAAATGDVQLPTPATHSPYPGSTLFFLETMLIWIGIEFYFMVLAGTSFGGGQTERQPAFPQSTSQSPPSAPLDVPCYHSHI